MKRRLNIGVLIDDINNYFSNQAARGAEQAARALDANLLIFPGHYIGSTDSRYADKKFDFQMQILNFLELGFSSSTPSSSSRQSAVLISFTSFRA